MKNQINRLVGPTNMLDDMERVFGHFLEPAKYTRNFGFAADVLETEDGYQIQADMPGISVSDVDVHFDNNQLVIKLKGSQEKEQTKKESKTHWIVRERYQGERERVFTLPENVESDSVKAQLSNGLLTVDLKKKEASKPINIKVLS